MDIKYDVFISYSRKDYVKDSEIIPDNPITAIQNKFEENGISYWFDKDGIYSGREFMRDISDAIMNSKMLVFISSKQSNESPWTAGEILDALDGKKLVIPVRIDNTPYNKSFRLLVRPLDYIDYQVQPKTALMELLRAVNSEKKRLAKIEEELQRQQIEKQEEAQKETVVIEIKEKAKEFLSLVGQQDYILKELYAKNIFIGNTTKRCPVCANEVSIQSLFCNQCGWKFPKLYGIDGSDIPLHDEAHLTLARMNWQSLCNIVTLQDENKSLKEEKEGTEDGKIEESVRNAEEGVRYREEEAKCQEELWGRTFMINGVSFKMIRVMGGTFEMGATPEQGSDVIDDERPLHQVTLSDYLIGETLVTQKLWQVVMGTNPSSFKGDKLPVDSVSWNDCQLFTQKLNEELYGQLPSGKTFRLPTEAEWEFAARGGNKSRNFKYSGSNNINEVAWYDYNSGNKTHSVGQKQPNELGLYDMSGNVWEWCQDWKGGYSSNAQTNPIGPKIGSRRVYRGGSWNRSEGYCRSSFRNYYAPSFRNSYLGLRLAL